MNSKFSKKIISNVLVETPALDSQHFQQTLIDKLSELNQQQELLEIMTGFCPRYPVEQVRDINSLSVMNLSPKILPRGQDKNYLILSAGKKISNHKIEISYSSIFVFP